MSKPAEYLITVALYDERGRFMDSVVYCKAQHPTDDSRTRRFMAEVEALSRRHFPECQVKIRMTGEFELDSLETGIEDLSEDPIL